MLKHHLVSDQVQNQVQNQAHNPVYIVQSICPSYSSQESMWSVIMFVYIQNPWNVETSIFCKADSFSWPNSSWTVQNLLDKAATTTLPLSQDCTPPPVDSALPLIVLAFLNIWQQRRGLKMRLFVLKGSKTWPHLLEIYWKPWIGNTSIYRTHSGGPNSVHLEGFHCIQKLKYITRMHHNEPFIGLQCLL